MFDSLLLLVTASFLLAGFVNRRRDDMRGRLAGQLDDILAQVGLDHLQAGLL